MSELLTYTWLPARLLDYRRQNRATNTRGVVLRKLLVGLTGFAGPLNVPNLTLCSYFGSSVQI